MGGFSVSPALPQAWGGAELVIKSGQGDLHVTIADPAHLGHGQVELTVDGALVAGNCIWFPGNDKVSHVIVRILADMLGEAP